MTQLEALLVGEGLGKSLAQSIRMQRSLVAVLKLGEDHLQHTHDTRHTDTMLFKINLISNFNMISSNN